MSLLETVHKIFMFISENYILYATDLDLLIIFE